MDRRYVNTGSIEEKRPITLVSRSALAAHDGIVPADAFITCRVTSETKARVRALAIREGTNESAIVKRLLHEALRAATPCADSSSRTSPQVDRRERVCVRISAEDRLLLEDRASARGLASAAYLAFLARTHLHGRAPLPRPEYLALRESILELKAIGRNLNQIAKALNQGGHAAISSRAEVATMLRAVERLRDEFRALINANEGSWKVRAATSH
jgi:hypothetical protein